MPADAATAEKWSWRFMLRLAPLLTVILIDSIGYTIVVPVLAPVLLGERPLMMADSGMWARYLVYGVALGIYEIAMLYMAPVLGELSDRIGRSRILTICLAGMAASLAIIGTAIACDIVLMLIFARLIGGAMAGSQAVAQAAAIDCCTSATKPFVLSLCLLLSSLGFILGPAIDGVFSYGSNVTLLDFATPLFVTTALALAGLLLLRATYEEGSGPGPMRSVGKIDFLMGMRGFRAAFEDPLIRQLILVFTLMQIAWGTYFLFLPSLLLARFDMDARDISLLMATLGVGFCLAYGLCLPLLTKRFRIQQIAFWGLWTTTALVLISVLSRRVAVQWAVAVPVATAVSVAYGAIIMLFSDSVEVGRQGWVLGITVSVTALAWGSTSIVAGALSAIHYIAPFVLAILCMAASGVALGLCRRIATT